MALPNQRGETPEHQIVLQYSEDLVRILKEEDMKQLCSTFLSCYGVIPAEFVEKFGLLDDSEDHLGKETRVRYLLQQVCEGIREDSQVYEGFIRALAECGSRARNVCEEMNTHLMEDAASVQTVASSRYSLHEKDIPRLVEIITDHHKWEEIGVALNLPTSVIEDCRKGSSNVLKLRYVLLAWINSDGFDEVKPATVESLRVALAGNIVGLKRTAQNIETFEKPVTPSKQKPCMESELKVLYRSFNSIVSEGKSTLLEVRVNGNREESYRWSKDGQTLLEGRDFSGVSSNMLYINRASKHLEGRYSYSISYGRDNVCSGDIDVKLEYTQEKKHLLQHYDGMKNNRECNLTFVNLVLIKQTDNISRCDYTICGDVDDILENKEIAEYEEIFREYKEREVVLIEGRPGSGKTTLVHKITQDWAQGKPILQGARYVFLVTLREVNYSKKDESLLDIIDIFYDSENIKKTAENEIKENRGKGVCFIIDGLDEYQNKNKESEIYKLMNKKVLPSSMVIIASRPAATHSLRDNCARRVEVVGFTKDQINKYVETYFDSSVMISKMKNFLDEHPKVQHMCYLPVQAEIICHLFKNKEGNIPHTETQIYKEFTVSTISRYKERNGVKSCPIQSLEELKEDKPQFSSICELAFEMTINSQQVVSKNEAKEYLCNTECFFGLLTQESKSERLYVVEEIYTFHHLTFQESLAAHHIASLDAKQQVEIISKYKWSYDDDILRNVRKFYCGLAARLTEMEEFMKDGRFLYNLTGFINYMYGIQCAFESQHIDFCNFATGFNSVVNLKFCTSITSDFEALGYVISTTSNIVHKLIWDTSISGDEVSAFFSSVSEWAIRNIWVLKLCCLHKEEHSSYEATNYSLSKLSTLEKLEFEYFELNMSSVVSLTRNIQLPNLRCLNIHFDAILCSNPEEILELLKFGSSNNIKVRYSCHKEDYAISRKLLNYVFDSSIHQASDISWLYLYNSNEISSVPPERFSHCTDIVLVNCGIDDNRAEILASSIHASVLEKLVLDFNRISDSGAKALAEHLAGSCALQVFSVQCNYIRDSGAAALASSIAGIRSLRRLDLQANGIGDEGVVAIATATQETPGLDLYLYNVEVTQEGISRVLEHRATTHIKTMVFNSSWDSICDEGIEALRSVLKWGTLQVSKIAGTANNSLMTNMKNIITVLAEEAVGKNISLLEVASVNGDSVAALCDILENTQNLRHLCINQTIEFKECVRLKEQFGELECLISVSVTDSLLPYFKNSKSLVRPHTLIINDELSQDNVGILCEVLVQFKSLSCLKVLNSNIDDTGAITLAEALKDHTSLTEVDLSYNLIYIDSSDIGITAVGMSAFAPVIRANNIQHLNISGNKISCDDLLLAIVDSGDSLQSLNIGGRPRNLRPYDDEAIYFEGTDWNAGIIIDGLSKMKLLVELVISNCDTSQVELLAEGLKCCSQLVKLGVCHSATDSQSIVCLSESIACGNQLEELNLFHNAIDSQGVISLAVKLTHHEKLQKLNLASNKITSDGVPAIVLVMENCRYLRELDLTFNYIGFDGAALLVEGWKYKTVLTLCINDFFQHSCESALLEGEEHCLGCDHLLQLYQFNDNIIIKVGLYLIPKLLSLKKTRLPVSC